MLPRLVAAAAALGSIALLALGSRADEPDVPPGLALGPEITCVLGASTECAGEEEYRLPADTVLLRESVASFGLRHGCALRADGLPVCWGDASEGQLGVDPATVTGRRERRPYRGTAEPPPGAPALTALDAGWLHTCGLTADGGVVCWGDHDRGQLGRSAPGPAAAPVEGLPGPVVELAAGGLHSCAVLADGGVACWGNGSHGQLGTKIDGDSAAPRTVPGLPDPALSVAVGAYHSCAVLRGGAVYCWGDNRFGQLGDGTRTARPAPAPVVGLSGPVHSLDAGTSFTCALLVDGSVSCWGSNELGELGSGGYSGAPLSRPEPPNPPAPAPVQGLPGAARRMQAAGDHACAVVTDGSVHCWGGNYSGQLGDGTSLDRPSAVSWKALTAALPSPPKPPLQHPIEGLDVSYHSGRVDWTAAKASGHTFGLTLATAGVDFRDPLLSAHWEGMRQAGLVRGAYHYFVADDDPADQARHFLSHVALEPGDLVPVIDIESLGTNPHHDLPQRLQAFIAEIENHLGVQPIIYTGPTFWDQHGSADFGDYPLWIAEYGVEAPRIPTGWTSWHLWQWRGDAALLGVASIVDLNRVHPEADLSRLLVPPDGE
ncbi:MAG: GH25 family lysozyme [Thermoanaerobaculia bacterium]